MRPDGLQISDRALQPETWNLQPETNKVKPTKATPKQMQPMARYTIAWLWGNPVLECGCLKGGHRESR
jgi:hypothetical protein